MSRIMNTVSLELPCSTHGTTPSPLTCCECGFVNFLLASTTTLRLLCFHPAPFRSHLLEKIAKITRYHAPQLLQQRRSAATASVLVSDLAGSSRIAVNFEQCSNSKRTHSRTEEHVTEIEMNNTKQCSISQVTAHWLRQRISHCLVD